MKSLKSLSVEAWKRTKSAIVSTLQPFNPLTTLNFFYPEACQLCEEHRAIAKDGFICSKCWSQVRFIRPPFCDRCGLPFEGDITTAFECANCREIEKHFEIYFSSARSAVRLFGNTVHEAILRYKYSRQLWFEPFLANLLLREALPVLREQKWDFIVPVPLHPTRHREREFNQAERLAKRLSAATNIPMNAKWIRRILPTTQQTRLTSAQRASNVKNAFAFRDGIKLSGEKIILIDDVFTTGATTSACAKILRAAGAGDVCVWTVARGL
ncbi:MAG TPA: ComF family protein [Methylomirabilota bacterium]|nr:ComF family protein [Methylomirabilota bacterium]